MVTKKTYPGETVLLTIGRMNPFTTGHLTLIETLINEAREKNISRVNVILSATADNKKNPLLCEEKRQIIYETLQAKGHNFEDIWVEVVCMDDETDYSMGTEPITKSIRYILSLYQNPQKIILFVGEDRAKSFQWISNYIPDIDIEYNFISRPEGAISATFIRSLVYSNNLEGFKEQMAPLQLSNIQLEEIFNNTRAALLAGGSNKKRKRKSYRRKSYRKKSYQRKSYQRKSYRKKP